MALGGINGLPPAVQPARIAPETSVVRPSGGGSFASEVEGFVRAADSEGKQAAHMMDEYAAGRQNDIHGTLIQAEKASVSLHMLVSVRNKIIDAYREVMRMGS